MGKEKPPGDLYLTFFLALASLRLDKALIVFIPDKTLIPSAMIGVVRTAQSIPVLTLRCVFDLCRVLLVTPRVFPAVL
jgi:hypothetical protein